MNCERHPQIETNITCANCGRPICPKCMVYTPVGVKCPDCARQRGRAVAGAKPIYYVRAAAAGLGAGVVGGLLLGELVRLVPFGGLLLVIFLGMGIGEVVSQAGRRNTGPPFQAIAAVSATVAFFLAGYFVVISPIRLLFALIGIYMAAIRLKD